MPTTEPNKNVITRRVFDKRHNLRGYLAAIREEKTVNIGWSFCNKKDHFEKDKGLMIAMNRAVNGTGNYVEIPRDVVEVLPEFYNQVARRFNDTNVELVIPWFPTRADIVEFPVGDVIEFNSVSREFTYSEQKTIDV
jgi:hypothetical protein